MSIQRTRKTRTFPDGGWEVRYRDEKGRTQRQTFRTKQQALAKDAEVRTKKLKGEPVNLPKVRFAKVAEDWYESTADLKPKTRAGYRATLDAHLIPALGDTFINKITAAELRVIFANLRRHGSSNEQLSNTTKRNIFRVLSTIFAFAEDDGLIRQNPMRQLRKRLPKASTEKMLFLEPEELAALVKGLEDGRDRAIVLLAAYTGVRAGEITALRVKNLSLLRREVTIRESLADVGGHLSFGTPKNGESRTVSLPAFLADLLGPLCEGKGPDDLVFTGTEGGPLRHNNWYGSRFKPAVRRALPEHLHGLRFHDLRHTAASILINQNVHPKLVSERLGHKSIAITMDRYGHRYRDQDQAIAHELDALYRETEKRQGPAAGQILHLR